MGSTYYVDPAAGGANNGSSWGDAWVSLQSAADTAVAGDVVYCRGEQDLVAAIDFDTNSGSAASGYIKFIGCNAAGSVDGTRFVLDGQGNNIHCISIDGVSWVWLENFELKNAPGTYCGINTTSTLVNDWVFNNVYAHDCGYGIAGNGFLESVRGFRCRLSDNTYDGLDYPVHSRWIACEFNHNARGAYVAGGGNDFVACIFHGNTTDGCYAWRGAMFVNCVFDGNPGDGLDYPSLDDAVVPLIVGCRFTNNGVGLRVVATKRAALAVCYFGGNTTDISGAYDDLPVDGVSKLTLAGSDTNHGYVDPGSHDFNLRSDATYLSEPIELD